MAKGWIKTSPVNFNPAWVNRATIKASCARIGKIEHVEHRTMTERDAALVLAAMAIGNARKYPSGAAKGISHKNKGGVMPRALMR